MPKVLISDPMDPKAAEIFRSKGVEVDEKPGLTRDELKAIIGDYDGLAIRSATKATEKLIASASNLKVIGRAGIGVDNVNIPAASKKGIIVMNTPFGNSITTAEHAIAMMLAVARQIPEANASTHAGKWEKSRFMGVELAGKTLSVGAVEVETMRDHGSHSPVPPLSSRQRLLASIMPAARHDGQREMRGDSRAPQP